MIIVWLQPSKLLLIVPSLLFLCLLYLKLIDYLISNVHPIVLAVSNFSIMLYDIDSADDI